MDMRLSGSGVVTPGEYETISVSGSCKIQGPVRCEKLQCSGSVHAEGSVVCTGKVQCSGSVHMGGTLEAETVEISGSFKGAGLRASGDIRLAGSVNLTGGISGGTVQIGGSARLGGDVEGETVRIGGVAKTPGLVNGETVEISPTGSEIGAIGGSKITVKRDEYVRVGFLHRLFGRRETGHAVLTVRDGIEGDDIELEDTVCPRVSGKRVVIGRGCSIGEVCYTETCTVAPDAEVKEQKKV